MPWLGEGDVLIVARCGGNVGGGAAGVVWSSTNESDREVGHTLASVGVMVGARVVATGEFGEQAVVLRELVGEEEVEVTEALAGDEFELGALLGNWRGKEVS